MHDSTPARRAEPNLLLVEPDPMFREVLVRAADRIQIETFAGLLPARTRLQGPSFVLLATNLRLGAYNGLHLVHLIRGTAGLPTRCVVYARDADRVHIRDVHGAGAFYELQLRLRFALPGYVEAVLGDRLPALDRREPVTPDRRRMFRGGRRRVDVPLIT